MNMREVEPDRWLAKAIGDVTKGQEFYVDGDYYAVWELSDGKQAIYLDKFNDGMLVCLAERASFALVLSPDDRFEAELLRTFRDEATEAGFPQKHPDKHTSLCKRQ